MDSFLQIPEHPSKRHLDLKICSAVSLLMMIGIIYLQYRVTGLYDTTEIEIKEKYQDWKVQYNKTYVSKEEEDFKFQIFKQNYKEIMRWNIDSNKTSKLALNHFADLNSEEFRVICCSYIPENEADVIRGEISSQISHSKFNWNTSIDFSNSEAALYDSWASSIVSSIESLYFIHESKKMSFSVDQLLNCINEQTIPRSRNFTAAYNYIMEFGLMLSDGLRHDIKSCNYDPNTDLFTIRSYKFLPYNDQSQLLMGVIKQPIVAAIQANQFALQFYSEGILQSADCGEDVNQAVLITGFGHNEEQEKDYWVVKNYWGKNWGSNGFILLERGGSNTCGILSYANYAIL